MFTKKICSPPEEAYRQNRQNWFWVYTTYGCLWHPVPGALPRPCPRHQALVRRFLEEVINQGKLAIIDEVVASDYVGHAIGSPEVKGSDGLKQRLTMLRTAFPDVHITIDDMVAAGDKVATRTTFHGTHKGEYLGIAPTGKTITAPGIGIMRIANGKIQENWLAGTLLQQLGGGPKMEKPAEKK